MFNYKRKSSFGTSVPTWLSAPGLVYLKRHVRSSKYDPLVKEVDFVHTAPNYTVVRMPSGRETTVSLRNVAPSNSENDQASNENNRMDNRVEPEVSNDCPPSTTVPEPLSLAHVKARKQVIQQTATPICSCEEGGRPIWSCSLPIAMLSSNLLHCFVFCDIVLLLVLFHSPFWRERML